MLVSRDGRAEWQVLNPSVANVVAIGRFDDKPGADILMWKDNFWQLLSKGSGPAIRQSRQDMR